MKLEPTTLAIFDYSGTLSLGSADFGRPDSLKLHLQSSGLAGIGIDTADRYWHDVVNPTWSGASTSNVGFQSAIAGCIRKMKIPDATPRLIETAVAKFLDAYLHHSHIDKRWRPLLSDIQNRPDTVGLIATDHYAEATAAIRSHLASLGLMTASPAAGENGQEDPTAFIIANSADIGCLKADRRFWLALEKTCLSMPLKKVVLVDDFGSNEQDHSAYAQDRRIESRIAATRQALGEVFGIKPLVLHFLAGEDTDHAIAATIRSVRKALP